MRFKTIAFALIVSSAVFILGCDDEDSSTIGGGGRIYFKVTFNPPLDSAYAYIFSGAVSATTPPTQRVTVTELTTDEMAVTKGQNLPVSINAQSLHPSNYCSTVQVKAFLNGSQFDVHTYNMGGVTPPRTCPDGFQQNYNLIIP